MKDESTGQQQPGEESPLHKQDREAIDAYIRTFNSVPYPEEMMSRWAARWGIEYERKRLESFSIWRKITVDGLPGDEYKTKWVEFVDATENFYDSSLAARIILWRQDMGEVFLRAEFTHWRPIDLPTQ